MNKQDLYTAICESEKKHVRPVSIGDLPIQVAHLNSWLASQWLVELCDERKIFIDPEASTEATFFFTTTEPQSKQPEQ